MVCLDRCLSWTEVEFVNKARTAFEPHMTDEEALSHTSDLGDESDDNFSDVDFVDDFEEEEEPLSPRRPVVPPIPIGVPGPACNTQVTRQPSPMDMECERDAMRIDLLSEAFCMKPEPFQQAIIERGMSVDTIVSAALAQTLGVERDQLTFYHLTKITSPSQLHQGQHIAVSIQSSSKHRKVMSEKRRLRFYFECIRRFNQRKKRKRTSSQHP